MKVKLKTITISEDQTEMVIYEPGEGPLRADGKTVAKTIIGVQYKDASNVFHGMIHGMEYELSIVPIIEKPIEPTIIN